MAPFCCEQEMIAPEEQLIVVGNWTGASSDAQSQLSHPVGRLTQSWVFVKPPSRVSRQYSVPIAHVLVSPLALMHSHIVAPASGSLSPTIAIAIAIARGCQSGEQDGQNQK